ncbi:MAG: hypothetical protein A2V85_09170 [Chloroflexi bacterium RBG_16_72_14]|nr:MAG: hypothetical protein A2V85_09170 [Chloroflexi bacterium RBG_16_72_14]
MAALRDRLTGLVPVLVGLVPVLVGLAGVVAMAVVKMALNEAVHRDIGFIPSMAAVVIAAWLGGFVPGVAATLAAVLLEAYVFMAPRGALSVESESDRIRLALFTLVGLLASWLAWLRSQAEQRARAVMAEATGARDRADLNARRLAALQAMATQFARAATTAQIVDVGLDQGLNSLRADGAAVYRLGSDGESIVAVAWRGYGDEVMADVRRLSLDLPTAVTDVAARGEPVFLEDTAAYTAAFGPPGVSRAAIVAPAAIAVVPLELEDRRFGVLAFTWADAHELPADRQAFIAAIARLMAGALERARLYDAERAAHERLNAIAEAGRVLSLSLDYEATLRRLAGLALPLIGDIGIVDVVETGGIRRLVTTSRPELAAAASVIEAHPLDPKGDGPMATVLRSGKPAVFRVDEAAIKAAARSPEHADALARLEARWALVTPLNVLNRTTGVVAFLRHADMPYEADDIELATELGDRAGRALENARLHTRVEQLAANERSRAGELEAVVASIGEGILVTDPHGAIVSSNAAAIRLLGGPVATLDELLARLLDPEGARPRALAADPSEYRLAGRPTAWAEVAAYPVAGSGEHQAGSTVVVCRDVSAFRQGQALREVFLGLLSHELRTPVTTIYGGSAVLARPGNTLDRETRDEILSDIAGEADRLYRLVEDLMVLARFDEGIEIGNEPALLQRLLPSVVDQERTRWPATTFRVQARSDLPAVGGDETSITQVTRNLLSNAAKYSGLDGTVTVIIEPGDEGVVVRVQDDGPGINPAEADDLFSPFYRSQTTARMAAGAGIGLHVSRRLVDAMGGRIWAKRLDDRGSEFGFLLPRYRGLPDD